MSYLSYTKGLPGVADVFLRDPSLYRPLLQFIEGVMTRPSELTKAEREILAEHVSRINGCGFCIGAHRWTLSAMGLDWETIDSLEDGQNSVHLSAKVKSLLHLAEKLTKTPDSMNESDINALLEAGWSEQAIEDAVNVISLFNYVNRLVDALGIENDDQYFRMVGKSLASRGYAPLLEAAE